MMPERAIRVYGALCMTVGVIIGLMLAKVMWL